MPTLISCTHTEDGSACNDCQNQDLAEALSEPEKEWWQSYLIPSSDTCRGHRYVDCDDIPNIIAEASRRAVEKRDQEIREMVEEERSRKPNEEKDLLCRIYAEKEPKGFNAGWELALSTTLSMIHPPKTP